MIRLPVARRVASARGGCVRKRQDGTGTIMSCAEQQRATAGLGYFTGFPVRSPILGTPCAGFSKRFSRFSLIISVFGPLGRYSSLRSHPSMTAEATENLTLSRVHACRDGPRSSTHKPSSRRGLDGWFLCVWLSTLSRPCLACNMPGGPRSAAIL